MSEDQVRAMVTLAVPVEVAFEVFTDQIDQWWRRGPRVRHSGTSHGIVHLEPRVGGRLFESVRDDADGGDAEEHVIEVGRVRVWEPPNRLEFSWRNVNFNADELTEVAVEFESLAPESTRVTVTHRGWSSLRADHPARHGLAPAAFLRTMGMWWGDQLTSLRHCGGQPRGLV